MTFTISESAALNNTSPIAAQNLDEHFRMEANMPVLGRMMNNIIEEAKDHESGINSEDDNLSRA